MDGHASSTDFAGGTIIAKPTLINGRIKGGHIGIGDIDNKTTSEAKGGTFALGIPVGLLNL